MASMEYLTVNSLTAYPFRKSKEYSAEGHVIEKNWFYDILFVSKNETIRQVYISKIQKVLGALTITFSNEELLDSGDDVIASVTFPANDVVNHFGNINQSFIYASTDLFDVKIVLGEGLVNKSDFISLYTAEEGSLDNSAIILHRPRLKNLYLKKINASFNDLKKKVYSTVTVDSFSKITDPPKIVSRYNSYFTLENINSVGIYVEKGAGAGLYDPCPVVGEITDVYSLFNVTPDNNGKLFLTSSFCYSLNTLTEQDVSYYDGFSPSLLAEYADEILIPNHSILIENSCSPKCPRENINSFAYYLNRVADGMHELNSIAYRNTETTGTGSALGDVFTATSFARNEFSRCVEHTSGIDTYINLGNKFIKNYHEFRVLQLRYSGVDIRNYTILEVLSDNSVRLNTTPDNPSQPKSFRVFDNGVYSNMNCATLGYNIAAEEYRKPYFKVKYTTNDAYNAEGTFVTYFSVIIALYNPSAVNNLNLAVTFIKSTQLVIEGLYKIRKSDSTVYSTTPAVVLNCREYAFIEANFYVPAGVDNSLSVTVDDIVNNISIGSTVVSGSINSSVPSVIISGNTAFQVIQPTASSFSETITLNNSITVVSFTGDIPTWLDTSYSIGTHKITLATIATPTDQKNKRYSFYFRSYGNDVPDTITKLTLDYLLVPVITIPATTTVFVDNSYIYTAEQPLFQVTAENMDFFSTEAPSTYYYSCVFEGSSPAGLTFNTATGKLIGKLHSSVPSGANFSADFKAVNPAGESQVMTINFTVI
jgi:hypothetical protein